MSDRIEILFKSNTAGKLELKNKIVMAPMTRSFSPNGVPGPNVADYYRKRAENNVGLIITEGTVINDPVSTGDPNIPRFYGEDALNGWAKVVSEVHAVGGKIIPQLWHVGMTRKKGSLPNPEELSIGPSGIDPYTFEQESEPMNEERIQSVIEAFSQAAADAKRIGFDGIEIHGAHTYLIDEFLWAKTNKRTDRYGGDILGRTRFAVEVVEACRKAVGPDFPIVLRLSQWKYGNWDAKLAENPKELEQLLKPLSEAGVDIFDCSTRRFWEPEFRESDLNFAGWVKKITGKPTITVGSVGLSTDFTEIDFGNDAIRDNLNKVSEKLDQGEFDLVAVGRALLVDSAWATKIREGRFHDLVPYSSDAVKTLV